jgi:hypothetical protein
MTRFLLWLSRLYHAYLDLKSPHVSVRKEWRRQEPRDR